MKFFISAILFAASSIANAQLDLVVITNKVNSAVSEVKRAECEVSTIYTQNVNLVLDTGASNQEELTLAVNLGDRITFCDNLVAAIGKNASKSITLTIEKSADGNASIKRFAISK